MSEPKFHLSRVVVKIGSSVLTDAAGRLLLERFKSIVKQVAACVPDAPQTILVSSGAIACGMAILGLSSRPKALAQLQACAAVGQGHLMQCYTKAFGQYGMTPAQVLLTQEDLADRGRFRNAKQTLLTLLHHRVVPIVNENDTVSVEEITFGDNDRLAALLSVAVDAQLLIILSDVDGFLEDGRLIERIDTLNERHHAAIHGRARATTRGGMFSKLEASRIAGHHGIPVVIANGTKPSVLQDLLAGRPVGTLLVPPRERLSPRKWWIAFSLRQPKGQLVIDAGASQALLERGKSLLASGILEVKGHFQKGCCVAITDGQHRQLARGIVNFSSAELLRIRGLRSMDIARTLGDASVREVVHRDQLVFARDMHS